MKNDSHTLILDDIPADLQQCLASLAQLKMKVLVTGAGGFLGHAICKYLRIANIDVVGFARGDYPKLRELGVTLIKGDLAEPDAVYNALTGCDLVFHVASKAGVWGSQKSYFQPNVVGSNNIIEGCKKHGIKYLIYTSTPSVTFTGKDEDNIDESTPHASHFLNYYGQSKSIAENNILISNSNALKTTALRPHLIWGPGDPHLAPRVFDRAIAGKLKLVGKTDKLIDTIYIDNAVYAHFLAALELVSEQSKCSGKAYFLSNDQPITMADMLNQLLACKSLPPVNKRISSRIAYFAGFALENIYLLLGKEEEPIMTRFVARQLSTSHYFNIAAAKHDFNYKSLISIEDGMKKYKKSLADNNETLI